MSSGLPLSIQTRLVAHAKGLGVDPNLVLARYGIERLLYRLSRSKHAERFVLKGALLLLVWLGETIRPTRDADLLGLGDVSAEALAAAFAEICSLQVEPDGLVFDLKAIRIAPIRIEDAYGGHRLTLRAHLGPARLRMQVDIGIGDAVIPPPEWLDYPSLLNLPRPRLRAYRPETSIAEKVHTLVNLGSRNSRMRDFFDVHALASRCAFDGESLAEALHATFARRATEIPTETPIALTAAFAELEGKQAQWTGFLRRNRLDAAPGNLKDVISGIIGFMGPVLTAASHGHRFECRWEPGGPWRSVGARDS